MAATVNSETNKEYILSVKLALDPEIERALQTLGKMRGELNKVGAELRKASADFAKAGGDTTGVDASLKKLDSTLKGLGNTASATSNGFKDLRFKELGLDVAGQGVIQLDKKMRDLLKTVNTPLKPIDNKALGLDVTGQAIVKLDRQLEGLLKKVNGPIQAIAINVKPIDNKALGLDVVGQAVIQLDKQMQGLLKTVNTPVKPIGFKDLGLDVAGQAVIKLDSQLQKLLKTVNTPIQPLGFKDLGLDVTGQAVIKLDRNMQQLLKTVNTPVRAIGFKDLGLDVAGQAVIKLDSNMKKLLNTINAPAAAKAGSLEGWTASLNQLEAELTTLPTKIGIVQQRLSQLQAAGKTSGASWQAYNSELQRLIDLQRKMDAASAGNVSSFRNLRGALQNTSYQLTDMVVQLQMGTSAAVAIGQQVPQLLGGFGAIGAAAGLVVALAAAFAGPLIKSLFDATDAMKEFEDKMKGVNDAMSDLQNISFGFSFDSIRKEFDNSDRAGKELIITLLGVRIDILNAQMQADRFNMNNITNELDKTIQSTSQFSIRWKLIWTGLSGEQFAAAADAETASERQRNSVKTLGLTLEEFKDLQTGLANGSLKAADALNKYGSALAAINTPESQKLLKNTQDLAIAEQKAAGILPAATKLRNEATAALSSGAKLYNETAKAAKAAKPAVKEFYDVLNPLQLLMQDMSKKVESKALAEDQLRVLADPDTVATLKSLGIGIDEIALKINNLNDAAGTPDFITKAALALDKYTKDWEAYSAQMQEVIKRNQDGEISFEQMTQTLEAMSEFAPAFRETAKVAEEAKDIFDEMSVAIGTTLANSMSDLVDVLFQSKKSFREWASDVLIELGKVLIKLAAVNIAKDALKSFGGGGFSGFLKGLFGFAKGASFSNGTSLPTNTILRRPTPFMFANGGVFPSWYGVAGEKGAEAVVPLKETSSGQLGVAASPVVVNVNNYGKDEVEVESKDKPDGSKVIDVTIRTKVKEMFATGDMDLLLQRQFNIRRSPV